MATDPVCQMNVEEGTAAGQSTYEGKPYYFFSLGCREAFQGACNLGVRSNISQQEARSSQDRQPRVAA
jgi:YHS domain-containing protein